MLAIRNTVESAAGITHDKNADEGVFKMFWLFPICSIIFLELLYVPERPSSGILF
jgi:hypothetical protein